MAGRNERNGRPYSFSLVHVLAKFNALNPRFRRENSEEMRRVLLPAIDLWISIRNKSIQTLRDLATEADKCQEGHGNLARVVDGAGIAIETYGLVGRVFSFISPNSHMFLRGVASLGRLVSSGVKTSENVKTSRIMEMAFNAVENDSIESESLDKWIDKYIDIDRTAETEAVEALIISVQNNDVDAKIVKYLRDNYEKYSIGKLTSTHMLHVCIQVLHELKVDGSLDIKSKSAISLFLSDAWRNADVKNIWLYALFNVASECLSDYLVEPNLGAGYCGVAVEVFLILKKMTEMKDWASRPKTSDKIKVKVTKMVEEKDKILQFRNVVQKSCDGE